MIAEILGWYFLAGFFTALGFRIYNKAPEVLSLWGMTILIWPLLLISLLLDKLSKIKI